MSRKFESGAQKRKNLIKKELREKCLLKSIPKLTGFFKPASSATEDASSTGETSLHTPEGAEEVQAATAAQVDEEQQGTASTSSINRGEEEWGAGESQREDQAANQSDDDPYNSDPGRWGNNIDPQNTEKSAFVSGGYFDWKHANDRIAEHESCDIHRKAMITYISQAADRGTVDSELKKQFNEECEYWTQVLQRVVAVVKFLSERGLAFRGDSRRFGDSDNGNYLGCMELISQFDPFLKAHIEKYGNAGRGTPSYLSLNVCEEFIQLMGQKVLEEVISRVKLAKYFAISVDFTPDITHVDQLTFILRYVSPEGCIEERFVKFLTIENHTGEALFNSVISVLEEMGIDIINCRGQCYDNANNMSGAYKGVQARIKQISSLAQWVPCAAHTLNLVGVNSVNCCEETEQFFSFVQTLFNFSSKTTSRWQMIRAGLQPNDNKRIETLKSLSDTRWSAHAVATKALCTNYAGIQLSLLNIADDDEHQNLSTREEARALHKKMNKLEIAIMCNMWNAILQRFHGVSTALQAVELDLCNAVDLVRSLREYVASLRDQFDSFETAARNMSPNVSHEYKADTQRKKERKRQADESSEPECELSGRKRFCTSVYIRVGRCPLNWQLTMFTVKHRDGR
ncbi:unnamed protein product [Leuciscus chuanchicus]